MSKTSYCIVPGCFGASVYRSRCQRHSGEVPPVYLTSIRKDTLPADWSKRVETVLHRDQETCYVCGGHAREVDHVIPGTDNSMSNLKAICHPCHMKKSGREGAASTLNPELRGRAAKKRREELRKFYLPTSEPLPDWWWDQEG